MYTYIHIYLQLPLNCWTSFGHIRPSTLVSVLRIWAAFVFLVVKISVQDAKQKPFSPVVPLPPQPPPAEVAAPRLLGSPRRLRPAPQRPRQRHSLREAPKLGGWMSASLNFSAVELIFLIFVYWTGIFWRPRRWMSYHYSNFHWDGKILDITNLKIIELILQLK